MTAATLTRIEWLKARRRFAFWMALLFFFGLTSIGLASSYYVRASINAFPTGADWRSTADAIQGFGLLAMLVLIVLLTASEKTWKTERQNVIDGLSRNQFFAAKLITLAAVALLLWTGALVLGAGFEVLNRRLAPSADWAFIGSTHALLLAGGLLYLLFAGAIGLFFAVVSSGSGSALALAFLSLFAQAPIMFQMARQGGIWLDATAWMPMQVLSALSSPAAYDPDLLLQAQAQARQNGFPLLPGVRAAALLAVLYSAALCGAAWWWIRRRDL